jgi:DNA-binding Xre family transcriptional regulator
MIKLTVKEVAQAKGFENASALAAATGIHPTSMYRIWSGKATRLDLATLDKLCDVLQVPAGLLISHVPAPEGTSGTRRRDEPAVTKQTKQKRL